MKFIGMMNYQNLKVENMKGFLMQNIFLLMIIWKIIIQKQVKMIYLIMKLI